MYRVLLLAAIVVSISTFGQAPTITSFSPASGPVGGILTIQGSGFSATSAHNIVYFGGVRAAITSATESTLTVTIPDGATPQPVSVTTNALTAYSKSAFMTTFSGGCSSFIATSFGQGSSLTTGLYPYAVCAADLDGDGKPDLIGPGNANSPSSLISYRRNTGTAGTLSFAAQIDLPAPSGSLPYSMVTADMDGDGLLDDIFTASTGSLCVYHNVSTPGTIAFDTRQDYATGTDPFSVAVGDLDGDGKPDIVVANYLSNSLSIYKNISTPGTIAFAPRTDLTTALAPHSVAIADLDGDGLPDLAVTAAFSSAVSLFRNQSSPGTLSFSARTDVATGPDEPFGLAIGDLDADGKPDLLVTYSNTNKTTEATVSFSLFWNTSSSGSLAFAAPQNFGAGDTYNPTIGDVNGDGKADLAVPIRDNYVFVYPNGSTPGAITMGAPGKYYDPYGYAVAISDLDGDNLPDIAVANFVSNSFTFFKNATTASGIASISPAIAQAGTIVTIVGVNLSSVTGVSFGGVAATSFTILSPTSIKAVVGAGATGDVTLTTPAGTIDYPGFTYTLPATITSISPASAGSGATVTIHGATLSGTTSVTFGGTSAVSFTIVSDTLVTAVVGAGASGDVALTTPGSIATLPNGFTFIAAPTISAFNPTTAGRGATITIIGTHLTGTTSITLGETPVLSYTINSDVSITAIAGGGSTGSLSVTTPGGTATLAGFSYIAQMPPAIVSFSPTSGKIGTTVTLTGSGFDPVGTNNIVYFGSVRATVNAASSASLTVKVPSGASLQPISVTTLDNNLTAYSANPFIVTFDTGALQFAYPDTYEIGYQNHNITAGDLDGDGKADLVVATENVYYTSTNNIIADKFVVLRNTTAKVGAITFAAQQEIGGTAGNRDAVFADIDGDGKADLAVLGYDTIYLLRNTSTPGVISFDTVAKKFLSGEDGVNLAMADIDGDGRPELITVNSFSSSISILRNTSVPGTFSFAGKTDYTAGSAPSGVAIGDFDGDGKKDLAVSSYNDNKVLVFGNKSTPGNIMLTAPLSLSVGANPSRIVTGDLDGDGKTDIATSNYSDNTFSILQNQSVPGSPAFAAAVAFATNYAVQAFSVRLAIADIDGDGALDLALVNSVSPGAASLFKNNSTPGKMAFTLERNSQPYHLDAIINGRPLSAVMQDLDGDGRPDMATANLFISQGVSILRNQSGEQPVIFSFTPTSGTSTSVITITGKNFDSASSVNFGGNPASSFTVVSPTEITALPPLNSNGIVSVTTSKGIANLAGFVYAAAPIINDAAPINATTGNTVTLTGNNFLNATNVNFGGIPATSFTVVNSNTITAVVGEGGSGAMSVTTSYGTGSLNGFTYLPVPTITSFTPTVGGPGTVVTITGTNFTGASNVRFGEVEADTFTIVSPTVITAVVGVGASGVVSVTNDGWSNNLPGFLFDPSVGISANGPTVFCQGGSVVLQSSVSVGNQWYQNGTAISGATADTLFVTASGVYTDQLNFPNLSSPSSSPITITANSIPATPVITALSGSGLTSSASSGNQWYQDTTNAISGANSQIYLPADSGFYAVKVTSGSGCVSAFSAPYFYHLPTTKPDTSGIAVVAPNPVTGGLAHINFSYPGITKLNVELVDLKGYIILRQSDFISGGNINMASLPKGVYILRLLDSSGKIYTKVSILKWN